MSFLSVLYYAPLSIGLLSFLPDFPVLSWSRFCSRIWLCRQYGHHSDKAVLQWSFKTITRFPKRDVRFPCFKFYDAVIPSTCSMTLCVINIRCTMSSISVYVSASYVPCRTQFLNYYSLTSFIFIISSENNGVFVIPVFFL